MNIDQPIHVPLKEGSYCQYFTDWLSVRESTELFEYFVEHVDWKHENIRIMGRWVPQPRLTAWYGDEHACYTYSGLKNEPIAWLPTLHSIKQRLEKQFDTPFNASYSITIGTALTLWDIIVTMRKSLVRA